MKDEQPQVTFFQGFHSFINILMGTGPILLPPIFAATGIYLSMLVLLVIGAINMICTLILIEALSLCNAISVTKLAPNKSISPKAGYERLSAVSDITRISDSIAEESKKLQYQFDLNEALEYSQMGNVLWGSKGRISCALTIVIYLGGVLSSRMIMISTILSEALPFTTYSFWVIFLFTSAALLSFNDIKSFKRIYQIVAYLRYITITIMLITPLVFLYLNQQPKSNLVLWNTDKVDDLFGTAVFAFLMQHSIPQTLQPIKSITTIKKVLYVGFCFSTILFILLPFTGMLAFSNLSEYCYYNTLFNQKNFQWAYVVSSLYMFFNISSNPVLTVVMRNNLIQLFDQKYRPHQHAQQISYSTIFITFSIILPCLLITLYLQSMIQMVVSFTGGFLGVLIMMILPCSFLLSARRRVGPEFLTNPFKIYANGSLIPILLIIFGIVVIVNNGRIFFQEIMLLKHGVSKLCKLQMV